MPSDYLTAKAHELLAEISRAGLSFREVAAAGDGTRQLFIAVDMAPDAVPDNAPDTVSGQPGPNEMERDILAAIRSDVLTARQLAERSGYRYNSHFRTVLSGMVRRGLLLSSRNGYRRPA